jgi:uncharacterized membrane protein (DUF2068 family)
MAVIAPKPFYHPARYLPRFHWELLACGARGHVLAGTDVREVTEQDSVIVREIDGVRWHRCLRCDAWVPLAPPVAPERERVPAHGEIELPLRGRAMRDLIVLRLIAIDRFIHFIVLVALAGAVLVFANDQAHLRRLYDTALRAIEGVNNGPLPRHHGLLGEIDSLFHADSNTLYLIAGGLGLYALVEGVEAVGLWMMKRWAEYLTFIATGAFLPYELSELVTGPTVVKLGATVINLAVLGYLLFSKRLFGVRGGVAEEERIRYSECGWDALERSTPELIAGGTSGGRLRRHRQT